MATFRKRSGGWEAAINKGGVRKSSTFPSKARAQAWAVEEEAKIDRRVRQGYADKTFGDLMQEYADKVSITKRGADKERIRLAMYQRDPIAQLKLCDIDASAIADWRDRRLAETSPGTVLRDWTLLNNAVNVAMKEWGWLPVNPMRDVRRPKEPPSRDRLVTDAEIEAMEIALGDDQNFIGWRVRMTMLFALETAMRAGEIVALRPSDVDMDRRVAKVLGTAKGGGKNRSAKREVPLSSKAIEILKQLGENLFGLNSSQLDIHFRKAKERAGVSGFTFHDLRHNAITNLSRKVDVLALARIVGHGNIKELMTYYNESAEDIAKLLD